MRLHHLTERAQPQIYYHGTSAANLRSILKHGLIIDPKKKNYEEGDQWDSLAGVYFSNSIYKAVRSATVHGHSDYIIVVARIVRQSALPDEDKLTALIKFVMQQTALNMGVDRDFLEDVDSPLEAFEDALDEEQLQQFVHEVADEVHRSVGSRRPVPYDFFHDVIEQWPTTSGEFYHDVFAEAKDKLVRYYRGADKVHKVGYDAEDIRMTEPVTFRGRNAIVAIVRPNDDHTYQYLYDRSTPAEREAIHKDLPPARQQS